MDSGVEVEAKAANRARFELELEFVQALANPFYLHSLAQQNILEQPAFVNFLEYLLYFKEKDYARFIQCVYISSIQNIVFMILQVIHTHYIIWSSFNMPNFVLR